MNPYRDSLDHLFDELALLDRRLESHLEAWRAANGGVVDEYRGLYVADETVDDLLASAPRARLDSERTGGDSWAAGDGRNRDDSRAAGDGQTGDGQTGGDRAWASRTAGGNGSRETGRSRDGEAPGSDGEDAGSLDAGRRRIDTRVRQTQEAGIELRLPALRERFRLDRLAVDALVIALAPEVDLAYETLYSYLQDDVTRKRPTVELVTRLLGTGWRDRIDVRRVFAPSAPLVRHGLIDLHGQAEAHSLLARAVVADERVADYLLGGEDLDPDLAAYASVHSPATPDETGSFPVPARETVDRLADQSAPLLVLSGPYGAGKRRVVDAIAAQRGESVLTLDAGRVPDDQRQATLDRLVREARLRDALVHVAGVDDDIDVVVDAVDAAPGGVVVSTQTAWRPRRPPERHAVSTLDLSVPTYAERRDRWAAVLASEGVETGPDGVDVDRLAGTFRLTPGAIRDAVTTARSAGDLTEETLYAACRAQSGPTLGALARRVRPTYDWDDIVLPGDRRRQLREVAAHIRHHGTVHGDWGFDEKFSLGNGLVVLFTGPSGTGKTMAAEILARDAGLDLHKIDLSRVVSKYIGETEKHLRAIFDEAERTDAILLFDEADALFGERSEVKDSHDRYANIEVSYLLQRVEEHDGTVVLTTNFKGNLDDAFLRRIHLSVEFPRPDRESREAIWRQIFPEQTPVGDLDFEFLTRFDLTGGNIRNVAQTAAVLAAEDESRVETEHVVRAMYREFQKTGTVVRPEEFGEYREFVEG